MEVGWETTSLPGSGLHSSEYALVRVHQLKNSRAMGCMQFATIRSVNTTAWLRWLMSRSSSARLWEFTQARYRKWLRTLCGQVGISHLKFVPSSARAGGMMHSFQLGVEPSRLKFWARIKAEPSKLCHTMYRKLLPLRSCYMPAPLRLHLARIARITDFTQTPPSVSVHRFF